MFDNPVGKKAQREQIERDTQDFIASGGEIGYLPYDAYLELVNQGKYWPATRVDPDDDGYMNWEEG